MFDLHRQRLLWMYCPGESEVTAMSQVELEKVLKPNCIFEYDFNPHWEYGAETEKTIKEIVMVHNEESALQDFVEVCH